MKARPILFSPPMVRALLGGRKTQTRRIVKPQPAEGQTVGRCPYVRTGYSLAECRADGTVGGCECRPFSCPYGWPGDLLWVRESYGLWRGLEPVYMADNPDQMNRWKPSIHMPRAASRLTLEITDIRVERLQNISEQDARAEGLITGPDHLDTLCRDYRGDKTYSEGGYALERTVWVQPVESYKSLWELINGEGSWELNPWVWVIEFKVHHANVDAILETAQKAGVAL